MGSKSSKSVTQTFIFVGHTLSYTFLGPNLLFHLLRVFALNIKISVPFFKLFTFRINKLTPSMNVKS